MPVSINTGPAVSPLMPTVLERAFRVAAMAHHGQKRKASELPYIAHPACVTLVLARAGFLDEEVLAAAVLHDVLEDTDLTQEQLAPDFPARVLEIVVGASETKMDTTGVRRPWADRKSDHVNDIRSASHDVVAVVLADKLHNLASMVFDLQAGEDLWPRFNASRDAVLGYHENIVQAAARDDARITHLVDECEAAIQFLKTH